MGEAIDVIKQLKRGDNQIFTRLYREHYRSTTAYVKANGGNEEDARDVFQEALFALYKQAQREDFILTVSTRTYLSAVVKNIWLYQLRQKRNHSSFKFTEESIQEIGYDDIEVYHQVQQLEEKHHVVATMMDTLKEECRTLLYYAYYCKLSNATIAQKLGYKEGFVKVKRHRCMEALREKVKQYFVLKDE